MVMPEPVFGLTYGELNMKWWNRVFSLPPDLNPLLDPDGSRCHIAQAGPVYYLHGSWLPTPVTRYCSVGCDKAIFIPLCNTHNDDSPAMDENGDIMLSFKKKVLVDDLKDFNDDWCVQNEDLEIIIDDVSLTDLKCGPAPQYWYDFFVPEINVYQYFGQPVEAGLYKGNSDGRVIVLRPLSPGIHSVYFSAGFYNVTYTLDVADCLEEKRSLRDTHKGERKSEEKKNFSETEDPMGRTARKIITGGDVGGESMRKRGGKR
jgi:hypothetical protein